MQAPTKLFFKKRFYFDRTVNNILLHTQIYVLSYNYTLPRYAVT